MLYILDWFWEIKRGETLTFQEIETWSRLTGRDIQPQEVAILMELDLDFYTVINADGNQQPSSQC